MSHMLIQGDARYIPLADNSVHVCVTSPPYFGLRDYQTARWEGGDDEGCDHRRSSQTPKEFDPRGGCTNQNHINEPGYRDVCGKCGARRVDAQIGLEPTPDLFVAEMVRVFREVRRVLRDDGCLWMNIGDSYSGSGMTGGTDSKEGGAKRVGRMFHGNRRDAVPGLKPKDLIGIPWDTAFALRDDGWYLRDAITWAKAEVDDDDNLEGSAMPGSQRDRCTSASEMVFLLAKSPRYFFDSEGCKTGSGAMLRNVWRMNPEPTKFKHFATFPRELPRRAISLGTSRRGVCPACAAPWVRIVESSGSPDGGFNRKPGTDLDHAHRTRPKANSSQMREWKFLHPDRDLGWRPSCPCDAGEPIPATVFDPFIGSGTTIVVAEALGRRGVGLDLSRDYLGLARRRIERPHARIPRPQSAGPSLPLFPDR